MSRKLVKLLIFTLFIYTTAFTVSAQDGAFSEFSPYSVYGIGNIAREGTAYNRSMAGVGIASRNKRFINYLNPASITAKDTLSFMMDFGLSSETKLMKQGNIKSANNTFNINDIVISFPIYKKSAFVLGLTPYSNLGYDFSFKISDPSIINEAKSVAYSSEGNGSIYQLFGGAAVTLWKNLSVGAQAMYYFGNIDKTTSMVFGDESFRNFYSGYSLELNAFAGKFGVQYDIPVGKDLTLTVGATYKTSAKLKGYVKDYQYASISSVTDTLRYNIDTLKRSNVKLASEIGVGISLRKGDKWSVEVNYLRSDWSKSGFSKYAGFSNVGVSNFASTYSQSVKAGFEIVPNRNDIRYYMRRVAYRAGAYYDRSYVLVDKNPVNSFGVTFGVTLPIYRWYNGLSMGFDFGQRGNTSGNMTRERYFLFTVGLNIHDLWFQKPRYE